MKKALIVLFLFICLGAHAEPLPQVRIVEKLPSPAWVKNMTRLYQSLGQILIQVSATQDYFQGKNHARLEKEVKTFVKLAQETAHLSKDPKKSADADLSLTLFAPMFAQEAKRAQSELKVGHREYARTLLKGMASYCIACHTRNLSGPNFEELGFQFPATEKVKLSEINRAEFYVAARQFDRAQSAFLKILSDSSLLINTPIEWERAMRYALAIAIRVKKDPNQAIEIIQKVMSAEKAPYFIKKDAEQWMKSAQDWKAELHRDLKTEESYRTEAIRLMTRAREAQKIKGLGAFTGTHDVVSYARSGDVDYLRASAVLHEWMQKYPVTSSQLSAQQTSGGVEALLMAGICYEVLKEFNLEGVHELYYETCVRRSPHTVTAEACYRQYEQSVHFSYTGSSGTHLPSDISRKLSDLQTLSVGQVSEPQK